MSVTMQHACDEVRICCFSNDQHGMSRLHVLLNRYPDSGETDVKLRAFPVVQEAELRQLIMAGAEVEIVCVKEADKEARSRGEWYITVHHEGEALVLIGFRPKHRVFVRFEGLGTYCDHTLELGEVRIPLVAGRSTRGMYHRSFLPDA